MTRFLSLLAFLFLAAAALAAPVELHCTVARTDGGGVPKGWPVACAEKPPGLPLAEGFDEVFTPAGIIARQAGLQARKDALFPERPAFAPLNREQLLLGLLDLGVTEDQVFEAIRQIPGEKEREVARIRFQESPDYHRDDSLLATLAAALALKAEDIDRVWLARANSR